MCSALIPDSFGREKDRARVRSLYYISPSCIVYENMTVGGCFLACPLLTHPDWFLFRLSIEHDWGIEMESWGCGAGVDMSNWQSETSGET